MVIQSSPDWKLQDRGTVPQHPQKTGLTSCYSGFCQREPRVEQGEEKTVGPSISFSPNPKPRAHGLEASGGGRYCWSVPAVYSGGISEALQETSLTWPLKISPQVSEFSMMPQGYGFATKTQCFPINQKGVSLEAPQLWSPEKALLAAVIHRLAQPWPLSQGTPATHFGKETPAL